MCFSATASFVAGGALSTVGAVTLSKAKTKRELPLASVPLLFGIQQAIEGVVWISFGSALVNTIAAYLFLMFAYVVWPMLVPIAVLLIEDHPVRKRVLQVFTVLGFLIGAYLLYFIFAEPGSAHVVNKSIAYDFRHAYDLLYLAPYVIVTAGSGLVSSHRVIKFFGAATLIAFFITNWFYGVNLISVWCFFAAVLSLILLIHFFKMPRVFRRVERARDSLLRKH